jgi:hypothetical protein
VTGLYPQSSKTHISILFFGEKCLPSMRFNLVLQGTQSLRVAPADNNQGENRCRSGGCDWTAANSLWIE